MISRKYYYHSRNNFGKSFQNKKLIGYFLYTFFNKVFYFVLLLSSIIIMNTSKSNEVFDSFIRESILKTTKPVTIVLELPFNLLHDFTDSTKNLLLTNLRNKELVNENILLKKLYLESIDTLHENTNLKNLLNFKDSNKEEYTFITTKIYSIVRDDMTNVFIVNIGSEDGVKEGSLVIGNKKSLVGRVVNVMKNYSSVLLLNDVNSKIPARTAETKERIILSGDNGSEHLKISFFNSKKPNINDGDLVYTSGDSKIIPDGIFIGTIRKINENFIVKTNETINDILNITIIVPKDNNMKKTEI